MTAETPVTPASGEESAPARKYTMSPLALAQRREAARHSTGPNTEEGKAASSRNAWKHGQYSAANQGAMSAFAVGHFGPPCRTTCPKHPENNPEHPCSLVLDGLTEAGKDCLDKEIYVKSFDAILQALETGGMEGMNGVLAGETAGAMEVMHKLRSEIADKGILLDVPIYNKEGEEVGQRQGINPALGIYIKLLEKLGINLPQLLATPAARQRVANPEDANDPVSDVFARVLARAGNGPVKRHEVVDGEFTEVKK